MEPDRDNAGRAGRATASHPFTRYYRQPFFHQLTGFSSVFAGRSEREVPRRSHWSPKSLRKLPRRTETQRAPGTRAVTGFPPAARCTMRAYSRVPSDTQARLLAISRRSHFEQRLCRVSDRQLERSVSPLSLSAIAQYDSAPGDADRLSQQIALADLILASVSSPPVGHRRPLGPGQMLIGTEFHDLLPGIIFRPCELRRLGWTSLEWRPVERHSGNDRHRFAGHTRGGGQT